MPELLIELFSEEIPARMQRRASEDFRRLMTDGLVEARLNYSSVEAYSTPRRLVLVVRGLLGKQPDVQEQRRGPRVDAPIGAISGFKGSLPEGAKIEERETSKGNFLYALVDKTGVATIDVLGHLIPDVVRRIPWQKSMRWGENEIRYVRPLQSVFCCFNGKSLKGEVKLGERAGLTFGVKVQGHRYLAPESFYVSSFETYKSGLLNAKVILDPAERRSKIEADLEALAQKEGFRIREDTALLDEVTGLVEWPVVLLGNIDDNFMDVPEEVLITSMRSHQKYFSLLREDGSLAPHFGVIANIETANGGKDIIAGNERVLRARLADAKFFWDQDRKQNLASNIPVLKGVVFHAKLGSLEDKINRTQMLAAKISDYVSEADRDQVMRAAHLSKADLVTEMVGEFPELQGVMGCYYAQHDGEGHAVAEAIADHYAPQGPNDRCPSAPISVVVALADKIDTLVGFWSINEKPTGSRDPYALRRSALGVIRLIVENEIRLPLFEILRESARLFGNVGNEFKEDSLLEFFADRLKVHLRERGTRHDLISAVFSLSGEDDFVRLLARVAALSDFISSEDGANLLTAYKRAVNIVSIEEKKDGAVFQGKANREILEQPEERVMAAALDEAAKKSITLVSAEDFVGAMGVLAKLRQRVDTYFDSVTVNAKDHNLRINRLKLLSEIRETMNGVADFSQIES